MEGMEERVHTQALPHLIGWQRMVVSTDTRLVPEPGVARETCFAWSQVWMGETRAQKKNPMACGMTPSEICASIAPGDPLPSICPCIHGIPCCAVGTISGRTVRACFLSTALGLGSFITTPWVNEVLMQIGIRDAAKTHWTAVFISATRCHRRQSSLRS